MMLFLIELILRLAWVYALLGAVAALWLHARLSRMDPGVVGGGIVFRLLITPGLVVLWPFLVRRALGTDSNAFPNPNKPISSEGLRRQHGLMVRGLVLLVPIVVGLALAGREEMPRQSKALPPDRVEALGVVRTEWTADGSDGSVRHRLRSDRFGWHWQLEFEVTGVLPFEDAMVYWMSGKEGGGAAQFVGSLNGVGVRRFEVPAALAGRGDFVVVSIAQTRTLAGGV